MKHIKNFFLLAPTLILAVFVIGGALNNVFAIDHPLVGHWKFNEGSGITATDSSTYGNDGTLTNSPTYSSDVPAVGALNPYSLSFDGTAKYVDIGTDSSLNLGSTFTLAAWVKVNSFPSAYSFIISKDGDNGLSYDLGFSNYGKPYVAINDGGWGEYTAENTLSTGVWHHIAGVRSSDNKLKLYVDGVLTDEFTDVKVPQVDGDTPVTLGKRSFADDPLLYDGLIDDARIYSSALSSGDIATLAQLAEFAGGDGESAETAYQIENCVQLQNMNSHLDAYFILNNDLDCISEGNSVMIGTIDTPFTGTFDGGGYTITVAINILENDPADDLDNNVGLFSTISGGTVTNLRVAGSIESTGSKVGGIVGQAINGSTISKVANTANVTGLSYVGGLVGDLGGGAISNSYNVGTVTSNYPGNVTGGYHGFRFWIELYHQKLQSRTSEWILSRRRYHWVQRWHADDQ